MNFSENVQSNDEDSITEEKPDMVYVGHLDLARRYVEECQVSASRSILENVNQRRIIQRLPPIEMVRLDGTPRELSEFLSSLRADVARSLHNAREKLGYLIYYGFGEVKEAIEGCMMLPAAKGYARAIHILEIQFGCPGDVAERFLNELLNGNRIKPEDVSSLRRLVRQVISSEISS
ncbi:hypothetical protein FGIG_01042 [Fasciola gigantica]|uniref:Uncharacterized protein n=1 Tax=Fasciola gigantica TaxID=46835 RepID=A0A504Y649_FASGI|nr:hypothetical protein FGIG_01042 [Fasciola gigantica]